MSGEGEGHKSRGEHIAYSHEESDVPPNSYGPQVEEHKGPGPYSNEDVPPAEGLIEGHKIAEEIQGKITLPDPPVGDRRAPELGGPVGRMYVCLQLRQGNLGEEGVRTVVRADEDDIGCQKASEEHQREKSETYHGKPS
ncbi:MAG: hypothetical protein DRN95_00410 [Candidatus Hydrothermarchaeota archaeon]|nr:MAG: hypothetical protein DRN95_00410 [Candidatus Hydrothermarchaeota archaeon]